MTDQADQQHVEHPYDGTAAGQVERAATRPDRSGRRLGYAAGALVLVTMLASGTVVTLVERGSVTATGPAAGSSTTQGTGVTRFPGGYGYGYVQPAQGGFGGPATGSAGTGAPSDTATTATAKESVGLVEITSTLTNGTAAGTGLILSSDGTVVTNHHVVAGATGVRVTVVSTGATYTARYVGGDATADIAVLKLDGASGLTPVDLSPDAASTGDEVVAVGDANGDGGTLTASPGTVAATDQDITVQDDDGGSTRLTGLVALNAYVVPGDSGGAVLDSDGDVVGMNVAASSGSAAVTGYAIPIATVSSVVGEILDGTQSSEIGLGYHGFLGVGLDPATTSALVAGVEDSGAADDAGIVAGDTITSLDGTTIRSATQLRTLLAEHDGGDSVRVGWTTSGGAKHTATVTLGRAPIA